MAEPTPPDAVSPARLEITRSSDGTDIVLALAGELDLASAPALEQALEDFGDSIPHRLLIDLSGVGFMDSTGLRALLLARQRTEAAGRELVLRRARARSSGSLSSAAHSSGSCSRTPGHRLGPGGCRFARRLTGAGRRCVEGLQAPTVHLRLESRPESVAMVRAMLAGAAELLEFGPECWPISKPRSAKPATTSSCTLTAMASVR